MNVEAIAVIGAGPRGRQIAQAAVLAGFHVVLEEVSEAVLGQAVASIHSSIREQSLRGELPPDASELIKTRLRTSRSVKEAIRQCDFIFEAAADELEMKLELFTIFDKFARPGVVFASTSSQFSIEEISDVTVSRDRCVGLEFLAPAAGKHLVEVIRTSETSETTIAACTVLFRRMGWEPNVVPADSTHKARRTGGVFRESVAPAKAFEPEGGEG